MTKYIIANSVDPYRNLAVEEYLMAQAIDCEILFLWQNDNTIVIGRNQEAKSECRLEEFLAENGRVARRRSGGGAVYHDLGNLNFSLISREGKSRNTYHQVVSDALSSFGIRTDYNGRNDILVENKKISGNAAYISNGVICQHGTILISTDIKKMGYYLTPAKSKLERNHVSSIESRVINLSELCQGITVSSMMHAMIDATDASEYSILLDMMEISKLEKSYNNTDWIFGGKR